MRPAKKWLVATATLLAGVLLAPSMALAQAPPGREHFVRGTVAVPIPDQGSATQGKTPHEIFLPHASVFLVRRATPTVAVASALTDLSGRFTIKTAQSGTFMLCIEAEGFRRTCIDKEFRTAEPVTNVETLHLPLPLTEDGRAAAAYGHVSLADGGLPRGFAPFLDVNAFAAVTLASHSVRYRGFVNEFGDYVVPVVPVREAFDLRVRIESEAAERKIDPQTGLAPGRVYQFDFVLPNAAPRLRLVSATQDGKPVQLAAPGSSIVLHAVADDRDGDKLSFRWLLPDGSLVGPTSDPDLAFTVPAQRGKFPVEVVVGDQRGGYARGGLVIHAATSGLSFSGSVVDTHGQAISGALVQVNGRVINTNIAGNFSLGVPQADRYVMTIRSTGIEAPNLRGFGTSSYIYKAPINGGIWELRRAEVTTVDPTQPIVLQQRRDERDCIGPATSRMDWQPFLTPAMVQWQDGRGNALNLADFGGRDARSVQQAMRLLGHVNPSLVRVLAGVTDVKPQSSEGKGACLPGIKVEIPANSLIEPATNAAPAGPVQVGLSTVALTAGNQMPGDYSATDGSAKLLSMESFGAGSIEIGAGTSHYNLKSGAEAIVTIPVDVTQRTGGATLAAKIPFLVYDEVLGTWKQDGEASLVGSGATIAYEKKVTHFSIMNADILKQGQACVAVELDPAANFVLPLQVEVTMQPSKPNPNVIQVRTFTLDSTRSNVIYNLPDHSDIVLTPIVSGTLPDGSSGQIPAGVFVVDTGGPMTAAVVPPPANPDGTYYAETNGQPTGPCSARVRLTRLSAVTLANGQEYLQGLHFESSKITEFGVAVATAIDQGVVEYYNQADPRQGRNSLNLFKSKNKFGQPTGANEVEYQAQYANSGDLGFGRDMHCRRNNASDGQFDYACYVTNYGQPPANNPDQQDADDTLNPAKLPDATVAMEYSRIENLPNVSPEFPDNDRAVKFFVYKTQLPDSAPLHNADLDNHGARPVPQLCMACHGGIAASTPADPALPNGPKAGAFAGRADILSMGSNFLPFDLHFYNFPAAKPKPGQQAAFKGLNVDIVKGVATANGTGAAVAEVIDTSFYNGGSATQLEDQVVAGWDPADVNSDRHRFYRDVFARACRTCHITQPFGAPTFAQAVDFEAVIANVQNRVCVQHIMPHAQRANDIFWSSLAPSMPAFLELYGQTLPGWSTLPAQQCSQGPVQGGGSAPSVFASQIYPILFNNCSSCHSAIGNANWAVGGTAATYNQLLTAIAKDTVSHYIVGHDPGSSLLYHRVTTGGVSEPNARMPLGGANLVTADTDTPPDGIADATELNGWINAGAAGP